MSPFYRHFSGGIQKFKTNLVESLCRNWRFIFLENKKHTLFLDNVKKYKNALLTPPPPYLVLVDRSVCVRLQTAIPNPSSALSSHVTWDGAKSPCRVTNPFPKFINPSRQFLCVCLIFSIKSFAVCCICCFSHNVSFLSLTHGQCTQHPPPHITTALGVALFKRVHFFSK